MITIAEARQRILQQAGPKSPGRSPLLHSIGLVLAADVTSDIDSPPHDKSLVDGYACRSADIVAAGTELEVIQRVTAGELPSAAVRPGTAVQIMTGAPLPHGADAVVMVEQTSDDDLATTGRMCVNAERVEPEQHIMRRGAAMVCGDVVLPAGHVVRAVDVGLLAEVGCCDVPVIQPTEVAVLATGNELVDARKKPDVGLIRNSNGPLLSALSSACRAQVTDLGMAADDPQSLRLAIEQGLQHDVLLLSGGVSAGVLDLVPSTLEQLGVEQVFHKVRLKPGKPMWFGVFRSDGHDCLVFGLPGNPVGSLVCFELFVAPVLRKLGGQPDGGSEPVRAKLAEPHHHRGDRPTYHPAHAERLEGGQVAVTPLRWRGSADQRAIASANCLILFPAESGHHVQGETVEIVMLQGSSDC